MIPSPDLLRAILSLAFVIGLIWLFGRLVRRYGWKLGMPTAPPSKAPRRLQIVESLNLDARNRVILIRRDAVEHLIIVNAENTNVIETSIKGPATQ